MRKKLDMAMLQGLVDGAKNQEISRGPKLTYDSNFPLFKTPVNEGIMVYIPRTNVITTENGEEMQMLTSQIHTATIGKSYESFRCIHELTGNPAYDSMGYDGSCPACDGMIEVWDLYNTKMDQEAKRLGVDKQNDPNDTLKPSRERILSEMDMRNPEKYVTFPIVIIPTKARFTPADDAAQNLQVVYVYWREQRYKDGILKALDEMMTNPGHPGGLLMYWNFTYDTKGKQATARDSAKNAKYSVVQDTNVMNAFQPFFATAEEKAKDFTVLKAAEVIVANEFLTKEELEQKVNKILAPTRKMLEIAKVGGPALTTGQPAGQLGAGNPLASFGQADQSQGSVPQQAAPMNLGQADQQQQAAPVNLGQAPQAQQEQGGAPAQSAPFQFNQQ